MNGKWVRRLQRIFGNWGMSFFTPLASGGIGEVILESGTSFEQIILIAAINATFYTGLAISQEVKELGKEKDMSTT
jgi:apolipoprotein N-acyltransferase